MSRVKCLSMSLLFLLLLTYSITTAAEYDVPKKPASIDVADIDLDGDLDIIVGHMTAWEQDNPTISILKNEGDGTFIIFDTSFVFCGYQENIFAHNIDNDNYPDIVSFMSDFSYSTADRYIRIFYNENGYFNEFEDFSLNSCATFSGSTIGDIDNDNDTDVMVFSNTSCFWGFLENDGTGQFSSPEYYYLDWYPSDISTGDLDGDGSDEIVVSLSNPALIYSYPFTSPPVVLDSTFPTSIVAIGDLDNDGDNDIVAFQITFFGTVMRIYENLGNLNFTVSFNETFDFAFGPFGPESFYDIDNNGYIDIICAAGDGFRIFKHNGNFNFEPPEYIYIGEYCHASHFADIDNNGYKDLIKCYEYYTLPDFGKLKILFNDGTGNFVENPQTAIEPPYEPIPTVTLTNYPNPFHNTTTISFFVREQETKNARVMIYNVKGQCIRELKIEDIIGNTHTVVWNGNDNDQNQVSSGVYLYRLQSDDCVSETKKMILMKND